jgi:hypothetical protein
VHQTIGNVTAREIVVKALGSPEKFVPSWHIDGTGKGGGFAPLL